MKSFGVLACVAMIVWPMTLFAGSDTATHLMGGAIQGKALTASGVASPLAGNAEKYGSADGPGPKARFSYPHDITTDGANLYVVDIGTIEGEGNNTIRKVVIATGAVSTLAGTAGKFGSANGIGPAARFSVPMGITTDGTSLYVADTDNDTIRKVAITTRAVTTLAGSAEKCGSADGTGSAALFCGPRGITTDGTRLYVADTSNNTIRQIVIASRAVTTLAGSAGTRGHADGAGTAASFDMPYGITTDGINLYVTDAMSSTVRRIVIATGAVTTLAGSAGTRGHTDGTGSAARLQYPTGITTDGTHLFVSDQNMIRKIVIATGEVTTLADSGGGAGLTTDGTKIFVSGAYSIKAIQ